MLIFIDTFPNDDLYNIINKAKNIIFITVKVYLLKLPNLEA